MVPRGFIGAVIVLVIVEEKGKQAAGEKEGRKGRKPWALREFGGKAVWDWLSMLLIPLVLGLGAVFLTAWFNTQQDARQNDIESQRAKTDRELAAQRAQDEALQAYLGQMNSLLLENDLRESKEDSELRTLARARTLTTLSKLDSSRKTAVIDFLVVARLIQKVKGVGAIVKLDGADLGGVDLSDAGLSDADLSGVSLSEADLSGANLRGANLRGANLSNAGLEETDLSEADLSGANLLRAKLFVADLSGADLSGTSLSEADLSGANLHGANLRGANLRYAGLEETDLSDADLSGANLLRAKLFVADLSDADLSGTTLSEADLSGANLSDADLGDANLVGANLFAAQGVTNEQLKEQASSLEGATMPNGQKYEDWLREVGRAEDIRTAPGQVQDGENTAQGCPRDLYKPPGVSTCPRSDPGSAP